MRRDYYDSMPKGMKNYLSNYGWHFSKAMCDFAVSQMKDRNKSKVNSYSKEKVESLLKQYGVNVPADQIYDAVYVCNMAVADYYGSSIIDELHIIKFVGDYLNDVDGYDGVAFTRFYADCLGKGTVLHWEDLI